MAFAFITPPDRLRNCEPGVVTLLLDYRRPLAEAKSPALDPAPRADIERRARFFYDDLLALFNCSEQSQCHRLPSALYFSRSAAASTIQLLVPKNPSS